MQETKLGNSSIIQFQKAVLCPLDGRQIIRTEFRERCFIYQSFGSKESAFGDVLIDAHLSFLADSGDGSAAEWEPQYGPIQIWQDCEADWVGKTPFGSEIKARRHWHFKYVEDSSLDWSQLAVEREGLKEKLLAGDFNSLFDVLERWANH